MAPTKKVNDVRTYTVTLTVTVDVGQDGHPEEWDWDHELNKCRTARLRACRQISRKHPTYQVKGFCAYQNTWEQWDVFLVAKNLTEARKAAVQYAQSRTHNQQLPKKAVVESVVPYKRPTEPQVGPPARLDGQSVQVTA